MEYNTSIYNIVIREDGDNIYLYNSYTGAFVKLEKRVYESIDMRTISDTNPCEYFDQLLTYGFIKHKELNEYNRIITEERLAIYDSTCENIELVIVPTLACNLNCVYCFENSFRCNKSLNNRTIDRIISFISKRIQPQTKKLHITWFGGEPLLAYQSILDFNRKLDVILLDRKIAYSASMVTNGTMLDAERSKVLSEQCALKDVQITIDGTCDVYCKQKGATPQQFEQVISNIKSALSYLKVKIRFNCKKDSFDDIKKAASMLIYRCGVHNNLKLYLAKLVDYSCSGDSNYYLQDEFDVKHIEFDKFVCGLLHMEYKPKLPRYRRFFCGQYKLKNLVIGPEGEIYKCEHHVGRSEKVIGDVTCGINYTEEMINFMHIALYDKCKSCKLFPLCIGGCPSLRQELQSEDACCFSLEYIKQLLTSYIKG